MIRRFCLAIVVFVAASASSSAQQQQQQQQVDWCVNKGSTYSPDVQLSGCSAVIQSGRWVGKNLVWAYTNRGNAYRDKGDNDHAIADYDEAIRLDPKDAVAYANRGSAYHNKGDYDRAVSDYSESIRLDPKLAGAYRNRGLTYGNKGDYDHAIADYNEAIRLDPKYANAYFSRGRLNLYSGALPKALADLSQASALNPKSAYAALWLDIASKRSGLSGQLADASRQIDMTQWPAPVIRRYLGQMTPEATLAAADDPDPVTKKGQVCEANFYGGELALQRGAKEEATRLFQLVAADCPRTFMEYEGALAELRALGVQP